MLKKITQGLLVTALLLSPFLAQAEIYKWTDKNGVVRYSDTPPYTTQKVDTIGKSRERKVNAPAQANTSQPKASTTEAVAKSSKKALDSDGEVLSSEEQAAREQAEKAKLERKKQEEQRKKEEKERLAKSNRENCQAARANYQTYAQGGRIYKTDVNGERQYLGDADLAAGKAQAQAEINKYCQ